MKYFPTKAPNINGSDESLGKSMLHGMKSAYPL